MEADPMGMHLTWTEVAYDPLGAPLPQEPILPGRPLTYQSARCWDCDWSAIAGTYAEITDAREQHTFHARVRTWALMDVAA
jgi:hypothetical protein